MAGIEPQPGRREKIFRPADDASYYWKRFLTAGRERTTRVNTPQNGAKRHEHAAHTRHDLAEEVAPPAGEVAPRQHEQHRERPPGEDHPAGEDDDEPGEKRRRGTRFEEVGPEQHEYPHGQMDEREAGEERSQAPDDVVKDDEQPQVFLVLVHQTGGRSRRGVHGLAAAWRGRRSLQFSLCGQAKRGVS